MILFDTDPSRYRHWRFAVDGDIATLTLDVNENAGLQPGYQLKLNSYDLGVDIELHDALNRIRFEHPSVKCVVITSGKSRMFCAGANIYMLGQSTHAWKVNFCKFTNETRNSFEDSSAHTGLKFLAALNGTTAGGGYEVALACDEILMIDDRSSTVSLPEVPLLGVLPGTGGLTRLTDKRKVRRDLADVFCTNADGLRAERALEWKLVDAIAKPQGFEAAVRERAKKLAAQSDRPSDAAGIRLTPLARTADAEALHYSTLDVAIDRAARTATFTLRGPKDDQPKDIDAALKLGDQWWPLRLARELDDAILLLRTNELDIGTWLFKSQGSLEAVLATDALLAANNRHWFAREVIAFWRRTLRRLDVSSRSLLAVIEPGSCFAGTLLEVVLACDRSYMLDIQVSAPSVALSALNFAPYTMGNGSTRLQTRFAGDAAQVDALRPRGGAPLATAEARDFGLVTFAPDDLDWEEEVRIAIEERASLSPDALTAMEASLRFGGTETMETRIFGRLSAWQNWVFNRPNAVGEHGALKMYGKGTKAKFTWSRI
jgi:benzoyl-CoA-dihydrodiol lyase